MVRKFVVRVNGKEYVVEVEELGAVQQTQGVQNTITQSVQTVSQPVQTQSQALGEKSPAVVETKVPRPTQSTQEPAASSSGLSAKIISPMSGVILKVLVSEGQKVEYGQKVVILEAMKMENDIVADRAGTVKKIHVKEGDTVDTGQVLVELE
ncbi:Biotin-requiring enzyme [Fervidobacterium changbaicum]|uniref:Acetyl-CoA carboxylase biotin carboxyl carrier protein subunit n=1 Tax=Fervidobacterium changbaicum TaxID=310769 RepID=A0ABX5QSG3_9BACT|nr:biotin/lipoyl-containing protein [Fervidobacterium changbaicum]QAV33252.1 acetyl-CoA carboxylase biotin carboxyl carrier protein subunit [Fervidobacterium changbaicum]SDH06074.1 Biotin-requiring enzyme [Fervidobacterium changbaicum]